MSYQTFESKWLGGRTDTDNYPKGELYQCVDLIKQYLRDEFGVPFGSYGNAIKYWTNTAAPILAKFDKLAVNDARQGDIVVLHGLAGNPNGHVGIATGKIDAQNVEILEQNGSTGGGSGTGKDAIRKRFVPRSRVAGLLRPKPAPAPKPNPAPSGNMPPIESRIRLIGPIDRTTFRVGTAQQVGTIRVPANDRTYVYYVRGYDPKYPGRIIINSASAGGNGVALALYYLSGRRIEGWETV